MCSLHLTHPSVHTWSSGQPTVQHPGSSRGLPVGAGIRTHNLGLSRVSSPTLYPFGQRLSEVSHRAQLLHQPRVGTTLMHLFERLGLVNLQDIYGVQGGGCLARSTISFGRESGCLLTGLGWEMRTVPPSSGVSWAQVHRNRSLHLGNARVPPGHSAVEGSEDGGGGRGASGRERGHPRLRQVLVHLREERHWGRARLSRLTSSTLLIHSAPKQKANEWMHLSPFYTRMHGEWLRYAKSTSQFHWRFLFSQRCSGLPGKSPMSSRHNS